MTAALLTTRDLTVSIAGKTVCRELAFALAGGEMVGLLGGNGAGKTTLLHTLAGLRLPDTGEIRLEDEPLDAMHRRSRARALGLLQQQGEDRFPSTVLETALIGRHPHIDFWRWESHRDVAVARRALRDVGLAGMEQRPHDTLSGGERRRLAIATILTQAPSVFMLDEPTNHLDLRHQIEILDLFRQRVDTGRHALIMAMHDVNLAARYCDRLLLVFGNGDTTFGPTDRVLRGDNLEQLYGIPLDRIPHDGQPVFVPR